MKCSIVIPCFNESRNIPLILDRFAQVIKRDDVEVVLVDNGSTDHSAEIMKELVPQNAFARSVRVEKNEGYGFGILSGLKQCRGKYLGWTHADMQTDPFDPIKALELIEARGNPRNIFVKGNRKGRRILDNFFTYGMSLFESVYLRAKLWDINAQPNIFHRSFFESWQTPPHDFSLDLFVYYSALKSGLDVVRFPVVFPERIHGQSHWNTGLGAKWKFIKRTFAFSTKLKKEIDSGIHSPQN